MKPFDLSGRVAIVTGASRGIGETIARFLVQAGASVAISGRKQENIEAVAAVINKAHPERMLPVVAHSGNREDVGRLVKQTVEAFERVDMTVNNAATNPHFGPLLDAEPWQWDKILEVNVKGYFWLCQFAARQMIAQGSGGKLINIAMAKPTPKCPPDEGHACTAHGRSGRANRHRALSGVGVIKFYDRCCVHRGWRVYLDLIRGMNGG